MSANKQAKATAKPKSDAPKAETKEKEQVVVVSDKSDASEMDEKFGPDGWKYATKEKPKVEESIPPETVTQEEVSKSDQPKAPPAGIEVKD